MAAQPDQPPCAVDDKARCFDYNECVGLGCQRHLYKALQAEVEDAGDIITFLGYLVWVAFGLGIVVGLFVGSYFL